MYYIDGATNIHFFEKQLGENRQKIIWPFNKYDDHVASRQSHARLRNLYIYKIAGKTSTGKLVCIKLWTSNTFNFSWMKTTTVHSKVTISHSRHKRKVMKTEVSYATRAKVHLRNTVFENLKKSLIFRIISNETFLEIFKHCELNWKRSQDFCALSYLVFCQDVAYISKKPLFHSFGHLSDTGRDCAKYRD